MKYQSTKAVTSFALVAVLTSMFSVGATARNEATKFTLVQSVGRTQVLDPSLFDTLQSLIGQVPTYENTNNAECPTVDLAKAKALVAELEKAYALLSVYKTWTQLGEDIGRRADNSAFEDKYRDATRLVSDRSTSVEKAQKGFFKLLEGQMYPESYPVRFTKPASEKPLIAIRQLDVTALHPLIVSLRSAIQNFKLGAPVKSQVATTKRSLQPGETIQVTFAASPCLAQDAWVGIVPSKTPHGSEQVNDQSKLGQKQYIERRRTGTMTFTAPNVPGSYDVRLNDSNRDGKEVASQTLTVEGTIVASQGLRSLSNLSSIVVSEQTFGRSEISYAPNARELMTRLPDPLSKTNSDFSFYEDEYYDVFYSNADGSFNPEGAFVTIEGVWRQKGVTDLGGGMNINDVSLSFGAPTPRLQYADYVSSFKVGSICDVSQDNHCNPNSPALAVDRDPDTFPRFGQTSDRNLRERFRLTIGFKRLQ